MDVGGNDLRVAEEIVAPVEIDSARTRHMPELGASPFCKGLEHGFVVFGNPEFDDWVPLTTLEEAPDCIECIAAKMYRAHMQQGLLQELIRSCLREVLDELLVVNDLVLQPDLEGWDLDVLVHHDLLPELLVL